MHVSASHLSSTEMETVYINIDIKIRNEIRET